jgi:hypothetical protein
MLHNKHATTRLGLFIEGGLLRNTCVVVAHMLFLNCQPNPLVLKVTGPYLKKNVKKTKQGGNATCQYPVNSISGQSYIRKYSLFKSHPGIYVVSKNIRYIIINHNTKPRYSSVMFLHIYPHDTGSI